MNWVIVIVVGIIGICVSHWLEGKIDFFLCLLAVEAISIIAIENYFNVYVSAIVEVPRGCCVTVAAKNTSAEAVSFANSNLTIDRVS